MSYNNSTGARMRVSRSSGLTLSTTWQKIDFNGTSTYNVNTFGTDPTTGNPLTWWDTTNKMFKFNFQQDVNVNITLYTKTTVTILTQPGNLQMRFVVPNGLGVGQDLYFPFPDNDGTGQYGYIDLFPITVASTGVTLRDHLFSTYLGNGIRTNGLYIEVRLSNAFFIGSVITLNNAACLIQSSGGIF